ncbi:MAG: MBL fold metallo-hydrolase [Nanoarchaeota archaeon]|nr:MBL fold metallo-hydrolase [Nanoarchaeota archaeon]MBU1051499.1 MBL fold metallo-hydrolase [Nanoarchaeota archaeon]
MQIKDINIEFLGHSGFLFTNRTGKKIAIDPYKISDKVPQADLILITHSHYDHCSIEDIQKIARQGTTIVIPADAQSKITKVNDVEIQIIEPGDELTLGNIKIEAIPAYNTNKKFHPKREGWLGYVIKFKELIIYHSGDSDKIPEMKNLTGYGKKENEFITLLPVSGKFVMTAEEASEIASLLSPSLAIPMHYGAGVAGTIKDAEKFVELCKEKNVKAKILERI